MALTVGSRLGHDDVTALIGEGGMGQVYRATDTQLGRDVALKILPDAFAADPDRLARFQREAQVLASLNHPGIAAIYGIELENAVDWAEQAFEQRENNVPMFAVLPLIDVSRGKPRFDALIRELGVSVRRVGLRAVS